MTQLPVFISTHWVLWLALVVVLVAIVVNEILIQRQRATEVSPQETVHLMNHNKAVVIDIRDEASFKKGHIIDSLSVNPAEIEKLSLSKYKNKTIIVACARGLQSQAIAHQLKHQGYDVHVLRGGITNWQNASLPLVAGA